MSKWINLRNEVTANDSGNPSSEVIKTDDDVDGGIFCGGYKTVGVQIRVTGSWNVTPIFWSDAADQYFNGDTRTIDSDCSFLLDVGDTQNLYFRVDNQSGVSPEITIWVKMVP